MSCIHGRECLQELALSPDIMYPPTCMTYIPGKLRLSVHATRTISSLQKRTTSSKKQDLIFNTRFHHFPLRRARRWRTVIHRRSRRLTPELVTPFHESPLVCMLRIMTANQALTHVALTSSSLLHHGRIKTSHIAPCKRTFLTSRHTSSQISLHSVHECASSHALSTMSESTFRDHEHRITA